MFSFLLRSPKREVAEKAERSRRAEERKKNNRKVLQLREKAKKMYSKNKIGIYLYDKLDERVGKKSMLGQFRRQLNQSLIKKALEFVPEAKKKQDPEPELERDLEEIENLGKSDSEILEDYKKQMIIIRNFILFNEKIEEGKIDSSELVDKQNYIRKQLGFDTGDEEASLAKGFKIIDSLNFQTLFVYDPDYENYYVITGEKRPTSSVEKGVK